MTYNVENLFDTVKDPVKKDADFLPLSLKADPKIQAECRAMQKSEWRQRCLTLDYSEAVLAEKIKRLGEVILSLQGHKGPDVIILQEVENLGVLKQLADQGLPHSDYRAILLEGSDYRGIDVAILTRLQPLGDAHLEKIPFEEKAMKREKLANDFREVLVQDLALPGGDVLTVMGVHLPAPFHDASLRQQALAFLKKLRDQRGSNRYTLVAGDFNITRDENHDLGVLNQAEKDGWVVAHRLGCYQCKGTSYYPPKKQWSFLDMVWLSERMSPQSKETGWKLIPDATRVVDNGSKHQRNKQKTPEPFSVHYSKIKGVSDHFPLLVGLTRK